MEKIVADTNVLVRILVQDDPVQAKKAERLMESSEVVILDSVLLEVEWVLRGVYRQPREEIARAFWAILKQRNVSSDRMRMLVEVVRAYEDGFDFADALHHAAAGSLEMKTFDRKFVNRAKKEGWRVSLLK